MRVGVLPDAHGNDIILKSWDELEKKGVEKIIQLGDWVDSHVEGNNWIQQKSLLQKVLKRKEESKIPVKLLFGNHDQSYITKYGADSNVSGHQFYVAADIQEFFDKHFDSFQAIEVVDNWIFSHAGVTQNWLDAPLGNYYERDIIEGKDVFWKLEDVNKAFKAKQLKYFNHNSFDPYGNSEEESCTWVRPPSLIRFGIEGYNQCVGHTVLTEDSMSYWNLEGRVVEAKDWYDKKKFYKYQYEAENEPKNLDCKYVFIDSPENNLYAVIDTVTNEVEITSVS